MTDTTRTDDGRAQECADAFKPLADAAQAILDKRIDFDTTANPDRGYAIRCTTPAGSADSTIEIFRDGKVIRKFQYPAYRVWNIAAHFHDIVDGEIAGHDAGYRAANWNGITPMGEAQPLPKEADDAH